MILELVGARLFSPYLGAPLPVITAIIGVILGCLAIGYWYGGAIADKRTDTGVFSFILAVAGISIGFITIIADPVLSAISVSAMPIALKATLGTVILMGVPSVLLGMVSPYAVRLKLLNVETSGKTVGRLYAISTVGSIVGTFMAGFYLISAFGTTQIIVLLAVITALLALLALNRRPTAIQYALAGIAIAVAISGAYAHNALARERQIIDIDTDYSRIMVDDQRVVINGRPVRTLFIGSVANSGMFLDKDDDQPFEYAKYYRLATHFNPDIKQTLMLGGGGYSYPKEFIERFPEATMDVVEIDPGVTAIARQYFNLKDSPRMPIYHEDGRTFLNQTEKKYDAIYGDAFASHYALPYQLATKEAVQSMYDHLNEDGVLILNIGSAILGDLGKFLRAELRTFKEVFPQVYIFPVQQPGNPYALQNVSLIALKTTAPADLIGTTPESKSFLSHRFTDEVPMDIPILTDNYAPVDQYTSPLAEY